MKVYSLKQIQFIPANLATVWDFFSKPDNLNHITPPDTNFKTLLMTGGQAMYSGQLIAYKLSPFPFLRVRWTTEITNVVYRQSFIDNQLFGPFALWHHQHFFKEKDGGVEMIDEVSYALPFGWLGRLAHTMFVNKKIKLIFQFRAKAVEKIFPNR